MKKLYFICLSAFTFCGFAQDPILISTQWHFSHMSHNGIDEHAPEEPGVYVSLTFSQMDGDDYLTTSACNAFHAFVAFGEGNTFSLPSGYTVTAIECNSPAGALFEYNYFSFLMNGWIEPLPFTYAIEPNGPDEYELRIMNTAGKVAYYYGTALAAPRHSAPEFRIAPNPASDVVELRFDRAVGPDATLSLHDLAGRQYFQRPLQGDARIDVSMLLPGVYLVTVSDGVATHSVRLIRN